MTTDTRRIPLTRQRVIDGAVALADEVGIHPLTIRALAEHLGVKPMALYHHVAGKEQILDGMVDHVFAEIALPPEGMEWREAMRVRSRSARDVLARHRWAAPLMETRTNPGPANLGHHEAVLACLRNGGLSIEMTAHAYALIDAFIYGFALQEAGLPFDTPEEAAQVVVGMIEHFPSTRYPHLNEFTVQHVLQPGYDFAAEFDYGLDLILDSLAARVAAASTAPTRRRR